MKLIDRLNLLAEAVAFTPLGILLGVMFGVTSTFVVMRSLAPSLIQHPSEQIVTAPTPTAIVVSVPTQSPSTPTPQATATSEPTARPKGANYIVQEGDNMINIVKNVCRELGYELWDQYYVADLAQMNIDHNRQYVGNVMQPGETVGIGCVLP